MIEVLVGSDANRPRVARVCQGKHRPLFIAVRNDAGRGVGNARTSDRQAAAQAGQSPGPGASDHCCGTLVPDADELDARGLEMLDEVEEACDRVCILRKGHLVHTQVMSDLRRQHRIRAQLTAALPEVPPRLADELAITTGANGELTIETPGELSPLLGWLATLPLAEVRVEPFGLRAVYDRFHAVEQ